MSRTVASAIVVTCLFVVLILTTCCHKQQQQNPTQPTTTPPEPALERRSLWTEEEEVEIMEQIRAKLVPQQFDFIEGTQKLAPHQFIHQHHMKTAGTSINTVIECAVKRLETSRQWEVPYYDLHECARSKYTYCMANATSICRGKMNESAVISFCAPLKDLDFFGWNEQNLRAMTVLRHPVDRVWSMFRFQTKQCYRCMNLTDIYDRIDSNETSDWPQDSICLKQLMNKEVYNLLSDDFPDDATEDEMVEHAIYNMRTFFHVIGLTERLEETFELAAQAFPWMALEIEGSNTVCRLPHSNPSPSNNRCIPPVTNEKFASYTHWDLPKYPDEETRMAIEAHNQMDMRLYEAAVQYFELQMRVTESGSEA